MKATHAYLLTMLIYSTVAYAQQNNFDPDQHKILESERSDGRYTSTRGFVQHQMRNQTALLQFDDQFTKEEFDRWKVKVRTKLAELMKFPLTDDQPAPKMLSREKRDGYVLEKWEVYPQSGSVVPILMLVPDKVSPARPAPLVLCYPGSNRSKEELAGEAELEPLYKIERHYEKNHMAKFYAQQGIISIAIDNPGIAELSDLERFKIAPNYDRNTLSRYLIDMGWHYLGLSSFHGNQILKWVRQLNIVDPNRIAVSGHSLGTEPAMVLAVLNPDIKALVFNDFLTNTRRRILSETRPDKNGLRPMANWLGHSVPGLWEWFDYSDLLASLAPRALLISEGGVTLDLKTVSKAYSITKSSAFDFKYYEKYKNAESRIADKDIPEGLSQEEYFKYANVDVANHYFKGEVAVPWLRGKLSDSKE